MALNPELVWQPTQEASLYLVWVVNVGEKKASEVQEQDEVHNVANRCKWFVTSNTERRYPILHDVEGHQECKEKACLCLYPVGPRCADVIVLLHTLMHDPDGWHKGQDFHVTGSRENGALQQARRPVKVEQLCGESTKYRQEQETAHIQVVANTSATETKSATKSYACSHETKQIAEAKSNLEEWPSTKSKRQEASMHEQNLRTEK